jgi:hypothetical protein
MTADTVDTLMRRGEIEWDDSGQLQLHGAAHAVFLWLEASFERLALEGGAHPEPAPATIAGSTLERAGYFESFPGFGIPAESGRAMWLPPAVCYHVYPALEGRRLDATHLVTLACGCGRNEPVAQENPGRLQRFRMREIVFVGAPAAVAAERDAWMARGQAFAASIGLVATLVPATDVFFGAAGRGQRLIQQLKGLKYELRMDAGPAGNLAAASFNLHESFFARRFDIHLSDGAMAASGCAAFGIERWTLALLAQLGPGPAVDLARRREP